MNPLIHKYLSAIGKKGGKAGKGKSKKRDPIEATLNAKRAIAIRWAKHVKKVTGNGKRESAKG